MLDKLPSWARHLFFAVAPAILGWVSSDIVPALEGKGEIAALAASLITVLIAAVTPLTRQYGAGKRSE
jgi:hypothetical protein